MLDSAGLKSQEMGETIHTEAERCVETGQLKVVSLGFQPIGGSEASIKKENRTHGAGKFFKV